MIKYFYLLLILLLLNSLSYAQIPNPGFENWTNSTPDGWDSVGAGNPQPSLFFPSTDAHSGNYSIKCEVSDFFGITYTCTLYTSYFSYHSNPTDFTGYFKYTPDGGDTLYIETIFFKNGAPIGNGYALYTQSYTGWTKFDAKISWNSSTDVPQTARILIFLMPTAGTHPNSVFYIDDLSYEGNGATGVNQQVSELPKNYKLYQNYPNPFNPNTIITFDNPARGYTSLDIYNSLGQKISTLFKGDLNAGEHTFNWNAINYPSGIYLYRISSGKFNSVKKMILEK